MKKKTGDEQQLHISSFIKQPASLKLLILAGTNIKQVQLSTIAKCTGLIKLDLSSNFLSDVPLKFSIFTQMKILYLHDNQITHIEIKNTQLQYISLFKNPMDSSLYRKSLIENNHGLLGIDYNVVTSKQKYSKDKVSLPIYSQIKWPIVQISSNLEHQDDYLNLLKAEIFVIGNVHKRTIKIEVIQKILLGVAQANRFNLAVAKKTGRHMLPSVLKAVSKWKKFTLLKKKLRAILAKKGKEHLIFSRMQLKRNERSDGVSQVLQTFLPQVRQKMKVRAVIQRQSRSFRQKIPAQKILQTQFLDITQDRDYVKNPIKLYFRYSELDILSKVNLYAKKLFFKQKDYDLCDQFNNLFRQTSRKYYIYRKRDYDKDERSWLLNSIHETSGCVLGEVGIDRRHFLYNKKGHKQIGVKNLKKVHKTEDLKSKIQACDRKIEYIYNKYDKLVQYEVLSYKILHTVLRILKYINAGNSQSIISTETAYFQTQVIFDDQKSNKVEQKVRIHIGLQFFTKRVLAANIIQRTWRRYSKKKRSINIVQIIRKQRAQNLISKWMRNIIFQHRLSSLKLRSYYQSAWRDKQVYIHLDIYMNMPDPKNHLRFGQCLPDKNGFYDLFHKDTQVQIVQNAGKRWLKILYPNSKLAVNALITLHKNTYRYAHGFYLKFFTAQQINDIKLVSQYEKKVQDFFKIIFNKIPASIEDQNTKTTLLVDNLEPFFIWSQVNALQHFSKFQKQEKHTTTVNIFIYNKHKRPLKVSCQMYWTHQQSLYQNRKYIQKQKDRSVPTMSGSNTPAKQMAKINMKKQKGQQGQLSFFDLQNGLKSSLRKGRGRNLLDASSKLDISRDNTRRNSLGSKNNSVNKSHRTRIVSDHRLQKLSETLNIRGK